MPILFPLTFGISSTALLAAYAWSRDTFPNFPFLPALSLILIRMYFLCIPGPGNGIANVMVW